MPIACLQTCLCIIKAAVAAAGTASAWKRQRLQHPFALESLKVARYLPELDFAAHNRRAQRSGFQVPVRPYIEEVKMRYHQAVAGSPLRLLNQIQYTLCV